MMGTIKYLSESRPRGIVHIRFFPPTGPASDKNNNFILDILVEYNITYP